MAVQSHDPNDVRRRQLPPNETGMFEAMQLAGGAVWIVRLLGLVLWLASLFGTYVPLAGGWEGVTAKPWPPAPAAFGIALALQVCFSWAQWTFKARALAWWRSRDRWEGYAVQASVSWWLAYTGALLISAGFSAYTYGLWAQPALEAMGPVWAGLIVVGIAAIVADMLPEWIYVRT